MKTEIPAAIIAQLAARWLPLQAASAAGLGSIDRAVNALRETIAEGAPHVLNITHFVMLSCYFDPGNRAIIAPLLPPEAAAEADRVAESFWRLKALRDEGFDQDEAVGIAVAEDELRNALPGAILDVFGEGH